VEVNAPEALAVAEYIRRGWSPEVREMLTKNIEENISPHLGAHAALR
jgi:hypothetical protein